MQELQKQIEKINKDSIEIQEINKEIEEIMVKFAKEVDNE